MKKLPPIYFECDRCGRDQYVPTHDPESFLFDHKPVWRDYGAKRDRSTGGKGGD